MAKKKLSLLQRIGLHSKPKRGRPAKDYDVKIYTGDLRKTGGLIKKGKEKRYPYTKREKKIGLSTLEGAGAGFVIGGLAGGLGGIMLGVPIGTFAGNIYSRKRNKPRGRPSKVKFSTREQLFSPREERLRRRENIGKIARAHQKTIRRYGEAE